MVWAYTAWGIARYRQGETDQAVADLYAVDLSDDPALCEDAERELERLEGE